MLTAPTLSGSSSHSLARTCLGTSTRLASMSGGPRLASMSRHERCRVSCTTHGPACQFMNTSHRVLPACLGRNRKPPGCPHVLARGQQHVCGLAQPPRLHKSTRLASMSWHEHQAGRHVLARMPSWPSISWHEHGQHLLMNTRLDVMSLHVARLASMSWHEHHTSQHV